MQEISKERMLEAHKALIQALNPVLLKYGTTGGHTPDRNTYETQVGRVQQGPPLKEGGVGVLTFFMDAETNQRYSSFWGTGDTSVMLAAIGGGLGDVFAQIARIPVHGPDILRRWLDVMGSIIEAKIRLAELKDKEGSPA